MECFTISIFYLVLLKERSTDVAVQRVREVMVQAVETLLQIVRALGVLNRHTKQVDEPHERVLVHGLDVGQVRDGEEQDG